MANFNTPNSGAKLIAEVLSKPNKDAKHYIMQPLSGNNQKNIHTPKSRKDSNTK